MRGITPVRRTFVAAPVALTLILAGCGGDDGAEAAPEQDDGTAAVEQVAEDFTQAVRDRDGEAGCALLDEPAQDLVAQTQEADDCGAAFADYADSLPDADGIEAGEVEMGTDLDGGTEIATADITFPGDEEAGGLELREDGEGAWTATRVPGTTLGGA
ncbi:hypothetical protein [Nocardiopsis salina]|uniref:hypothetical protein n=1 Tax=Nocardiopsis salina TaxID=245836 RepID=UPI000377F7AA|nr:hypothetical protein [Nocardiopsis salina]